MPGQVWGGDPKCKHKWGGKIRSGEGYSSGSRKRWQHKQNREDNPDTWQSETKQGKFCQKCGAWFGSLGLEPTFELYVEHMVEIFREVKRVLRDDGTVWLNMGDSYTGGFTGRNDTTDKYESNVLLRGQQKGIEKQSRPRPVPPGLKPKDLCGIPWRLAFALQADGWWLRSDIIWCLSGGVKVYAKTQKGEMPTTIKDLARLKPETVKLWNGKDWIQLLGMSKLPRKGNEIEIVLRSGERISCTPNHKWPTDRGVIEAREIKIGDVVKTCGLPSPVPVINIPGLPSSDIGWFVGTYLADGSRDSTDTIQIASHTKEKERYIRLKGIADYYGEYCTKHIASENSMTILMNGKILRAIINKYISGKTAKGKHPSPECWKRDVIFLCSLLDGYLQGDGHYEEKNDRWRLGFTRNYSLEADLRTLCARLGFSIRLKPTKVKMGDRYFDSFRGEIRFQKSNHHNTKQDSEVVEIRRARARYFYNIGVEGEPHLFALASGVLTHNSKPNPMPESVLDRPTKSHEYIFLLTKSPKYFYDIDAVREPHAHKDAYLNTGDWKKSVKELGFVDKLPDAKAANRAMAMSRSKDYIGHIAGRNLRDVWSISTQSFPESHFATFPQELVRRPILAGTSEKGCCSKCGAPWERVIESNPVGQPRKESEAWNSGTGLLPHKGYCGSPDIKTLGFRLTCSCETTDTRPCIVFDPFAGAGTTGVVALKLNRRFIGVELNPDYTKMAKNRINKSLRGKVETITSTETKEDKVKDKSYVVDLFE